jgi:hypothetical protein
VPHFHAFSTYVYVMILSFILVTRHGRLTLLGFLVYFLLIQRRALDWRLKKLLSFSLWYLCLPTGYGLDVQGVGIRVPVGAGIFSSPCCPNRLLGPPSTGGSSPEVKQPGREADHSTPTSAEVKQTWVYTSTPPYVFMA